MHKRESHRPRLNPSAQDTSVTAEQIRTYDAPSLLLVASSLVYTLDPLVRYWVPLSELSRLFLILDESLEPACTLESTTHVSLVLIYVYIIFNILVSINIILKMKIPLVQGQCIYCLIEAQRDYLLDIIQQWKVKTPPMSICMQACMIY